MLIGVTAAGLVAMAVYFSFAAKPPTALPSAASPSHEAPAANTATATATARPTATFTPVSEPTEVQSPSPTTAPTATSTPDAVQITLDNGGLIFAGPLSNDQQVALYRASLGYVQSSVADSRSMAKQINGVGYGDPSNICGPLAVAILRDAGLMVPNIVPHDFWLLNPLAATDAALLERAFPFDRYMHAIIPTAINKVNWNATPLVPGDFIFIWHGSGGNFDHMLVVNRVDAELRAYAVTNYGTSEGYVIAESLLYDPRDPTVGLFHQWTKERDAILGSTGFGGYELWRLRSP